MLELLAIGLVIILYPYQSIELLAIGPIGLKPYVLVLPTYLILKIIELLYNRSNYNQSVLPFLKNVRKNKIVLLTTILIGYAAASILWADNKTVVISAMIKYGYFYGVFLLILYSSSINWKKTLVVIGYSSACSIILLSMVMYFNVIQAGFSYIRWLLASSVVSGSDKFHEYSNILGKYSFGGGGHRNFIGSWILFCWICVLFTLDQLKNINYVVLSLIAIFTVPAFQLTISKTAWVGFFVFVAFTVIAFFLKINKHFIKFVLILCCVNLVFFITNYVGITGATLERFNVVIPALQTVQSEDFTAPPKQQISETLKPGKNETSVSQIDDEKTVGSRLLLYKMALQFFGEKPLLGYGLWNNADKYRIPATGWVDNPHNIFLQFLSDLGIVGFILLASVLLIIIFYTLRIIFKRNINSYVNTSALTALILLATYLVQSMFNFQFSELIIWLPLAVSVSPQFFGKEEVVYEGN